MNSPIPNRLLSNKEYKTSSLIPKKRSKKVIESVDVVQVEQLVNDLCSVPLELDNFENENFIFDILIDDIEELGEEEEKKIDQKKNLDPLIKFFIMLKKLVTKLPNSINMDFEIAAMNAAQIAYGCRIYGCFFHLSQSLWRRVQNRGLVKQWYDEKFRISFRRIQALAFIPVQDVPKAFEHIKESCPQSFIQIISYFELNYIGRMKFDKRCKPRFSIDSWNLHERCKDDLPRTNNDVESWHSRLKKDSKQNLTVAKVIEIFRLEQNYMEANLINIFQGKKIKRVNKAEIEKNESLKKIIFSYSSSNLELHLDGIANLLIEK